MTRIFGIKFGSETANVKAEKKDKIQEIAQPKIKESGVLLSPIKLGKRLVSWVKNQFWSLVDSFYPAKTPPSVDKAHLINQERVLTHSDIIPKEMEYLDYDVGELVAVKIAENLYEKVEIAAIKADKENPKLDAIITHEGERIPISSIYKINGLNQTKLIEKDKPGTVLKPPFSDSFIQQIPHLYDVKPGEKVIYKTNNEVKIVQVIEIDKSGELKVFDGRRIFPINYSQLYKFSSKPLDLQNIVLNNTLDRSKIYPISEIHINDIVAYRYQSDKSEQDDLYKLVKVVDISGDKIIVYNGRNHFEADEQHIFGANIQDFKAKVEDALKIGSKIDRNQLKENELEHTDDLNIGQKIAVPGISGYYIVEVKMKTNTHVLAYDGTFSKWIPLNQIKLLRQN